MGPRTRDGSLKAVYLTGSHTWNNLVDMDRADPPAPFDYGGYLDFLQRYGHNFIRLWTWDSVMWDSRANGKLGKDFVHHVAPLPWARTGPGNALDGKPKFDLTKFNPEYFDRLRTRVRAAGERGIYVSVMLFEGWGLSHAQPSRAGRGWLGLSQPSLPPGQQHQRHQRRSQRRRQRPGDTFAGQRRASTALQAAYIRKVVDTVNDLDNVLYEVINEGGQAGVGLVGGQDDQRLRANQAQAAPGRHHRPRRREAGHHAGQPGGLDFARRSGRLSRRRRRRGTAARSACWTPITSGASAAIMAGSGRASCAGTIRSSWTPTTAPSSEIGWMQTLSCSAAIWAIRCVTPGR